MQLGASGVQMGTRFVTTEECDASPEFKQSYIDATPEDIEIIKSPVGMPGRALGSSFLEMVKQGKRQPLHCPFQCIKTCEVSSSPYCIITALINALKGNFEKGYALCGSNAFKATKITTVKELVQTLVSEFKASVTAK
jgi:NAD(P)H-dependent flavin oxidoreductase YrpB (nitropropane dioxygenase family)